MLRYAFQSNFDAPVTDALEKGTVVLDSGCGPATWTLELSEQYPKSTFYGIDIASVFPEQIVPDNCKFMIANVTETLPFPDNHFDYIHQRLLVAGLTAEGWEKCIIELKRVLKPGGILELKECELDTYNSGTNTGKIVDACTEINADLKGLVPSVAQDLHVMLKKHGFNDIHSRYLPIPLNYGKLGQMYWDDFKSFFIALKSIFIQRNLEQFGATDEEFNERLADCGEGCVANGTIIRWHVVYATKPSEAE